MFEFEEAVKMKPEIIEGRSQEQIEKMRKAADHLAALMGALFEENDEKKMEELKMQTIKHIKAELGEECKVDVDMLHDALTKLPAEIYLKLYHKMQEKVLGYPGFYGGCGAPSTEEEKME